MNERVAYNTSHHLYYEHSNLMYKPDLTAVDQCVMCGMCQPHCPTYNVEHIETESPRGRLSMMLSMAQDPLDIDSSIALHINNCSGCGACEAMCPSRVPFMQLIDDSKQLIQKRPLVLKTLLTLVRNPARYGLLRATLSSAKLGSVLRLFGLLKKDTKALQHSIDDRQTDDSLQNYYPAHIQLNEQARGNIGLFTGCITQLFDRSTLNDTITLLTHCGYNVHVSNQQVCCGALHQHNGDIPTAKLLANQNQQAFQTKTLDAVIFTSTGCGVQLKSSLKQTAVYDIMEFIAEHKLIEQLQLNPISSSALIHEPCSQRNQLKLPAITPLMAHIPQLKTHEMAGNNFCCGAGGINMLTIPASAQKLRQPKIDDIKTKQPDMVVTTNYGCALHLASGLYDLIENKQIDFCHPVSLLVRSASLQ